MQIYGTRNRWGKQKEANKPFGKKKATNERTVERMEADELERPNGKSGIMGYNKIEKSGDMTLHSGFSKWIRCSHI